MQIWFVISYEEARNKINKLRIVENCWELTLNTRMVNPKSKPVSIAIHGGEIVHIKMHRHRSGLTFHEAFPA